MKHPNLVPGLTGPLTVRNFDVKAAAAVVNDSAQESSVWTIKRAVQWAAEDFSKRGIPSHRLEAELLLCEVLQADRVRLIMDATRPLTSDELGAFRALIMRRREGEPLAHIVGYREFYGRRFLVSRDVLIPRPDTEVLVELAIDKTKHRDLYGRALDLCTGSGCIAISFAKARPTWKVTATDISDAALAVAEKNALRHGAHHNLRLLKGDLFAALPQKERFELIVSNPPYIPNAEVPTLELSVAQFEPRLALEGGADGLDYYRRLAEQARAFLVPGGVLAVEVGAGQAPDVQELFTQAGFIEPERHRDLGGHERVVAVRAPR